MATRGSEKHGYDAGRLNLPFVGHCTFGKQPICTDWRKIDADVAILGVAAFTASIESGKSPVTTSTIGTRLADSPS